MKYLAFFIVALSLASNALAKVWTYNWDITWVLANPDGKLVRPVMGINNQWPNPLVNITVGDRLVVHVTNKLGNETTGIHWHGFFQNGTNAMDGPRGVTGCPIPPGGSYTFDFTVRA
jgi:iron transport multicopper oxidase